MKINNRVSYRQYGGVTLTTSNFQIALETALKNGSSFLQFEILQILHLYDPNTGLQIKEEINKFEVENCTKDHFPYITQERFEIYALWKRKCLSLNYTGYMV